jgi:heme-degrading monooxygenase HmoA
MIETIIGAKNGFATGINVFQLPNARRRELLEALHAINEVILREKLGMIVASNFHVGIDGPMVINYNQYTDRKLGQVLRTIPAAVPLTKLTHDVSDHHEIRWYDVADVVTARPPGGEIHILPGSNAVAAIGIFTVAPERQDALLAALKSYGEALKAASAPGFVGIATHRGHKPEHVASYEQWESAEAYRRAAGVAAIAAARDRVRGLADECLLHTYEVVEQARFDLGEIAAAGAATSD